MELSSTVDKPASHPCLKMVCRLSVGFCGFLARRTVRFSLLSPCFLPCRNTGHGCGLGCAVWWDNCFQLPPLGLFLGPLHVAGSFVPCIVAVISGCSWFGTLQSAALQFGGTSGSACGSLCPSPYGLKLRGLSAPTPQLSDSLFFPSSFGHQKPILPLSVVMTTFTF